MGVARLLFALAPGDLFGFAPSVLCLSRPGRLRAHGNRGRKRGWQASGPGFGALWGPLRGCARLELPARSEREPGALHRDQGHGVRSMPIRPEAFSGPAQAKIRALLCNLASPYRDRPRGAPPGRPHSLLPSVAPGDRLRLSGCHSRPQAGADARIVLSGLAIRGRALLFAATLRGFHGIRIGPPCFGCFRASARRGSSGALAGRASPGTRDDEFRACGRCRRARRLMPRSARVHHSLREAHPQAPGRAGRR